MAKPFNPPQPLPPAPEPEAPLVPEIPPAPEVIPPEADPAPEAELPPQAPAAPEGLNTYRVNWLLDSFKGQLCVEGDTVQATDAEAAELGSVLTLVEN